MCIVFYLCNQNKLHDSLIFKERIEFKPIEIDDLPEISKILQCQTYRTCDFTIGGIFMWVPYFKYEYAIYAETLFIKGLSEINSSETAFSLPIGKLSVDDSIRVLQTYCEQNGLKFILSAVPIPAIDYLISTYKLVPQQLIDWSDYLYDATQLASLKGKLYNKKRNHTNRFSKTYPDYKYQRITSQNIFDVGFFFEQYKARHNEYNELFRNELNTTEIIVNNYFKFNFIGAVIEIENKIVAFTIGEVIKDTLYIHIEKAFSEYSGIYETINMKFASDIIEHYPQVLYINREEDVGDPGLRKAKLSYNPILILEKYNLCEM